MLSLEIDTNAVYENARKITNFVQVPVIGVVKCDGYGLSIAVAAKAWQAAGVKMFAVSTPQEALELRSKGFTEDILLMTPAADILTLQQLLSADIILTVTSLQNAKWYCEHCSLRHPVRVHIAVDTGMGRFGVRYDDLPQLKAIYNLPQLLKEGIFSHFSASFEKRYRKTKLQLEHFENTASTLENMGYCVGMRHIANSCAALRFPQTRLDAVRVGSAITGRSCVNVPLSLHKVGEMRAQVVDIKEFKRGEYTGYGSVCKIKRDAKAVIVNIGTQNGFGICKNPTNLPPLCIINSCLKMLGKKKTPCVFYGETQLPLLGRIGTQYTLFDASNVSIHPGDFVSADANMLFPAQKRTYR